MKKRKTSQPALIVYFVCSVGGILGLLNVWNTKYLSAQLTSYIKIEDDGLEGKKNLFNGFIVVAN